MLGRSLVLALALAPGPEPASTSSRPDELPHWSTVPAPPPQPAKAQPLVPNDGGGMITFGSILLGTGTTLGLSAVGITIADPDQVRQNQTPRNVAAVASLFGLGSGTVLLAIGVAVRKQFRRSPASNIPDAPRTGNAMLLGGLGLLSLGTGFTIHAVVDIAYTCEASHCLPQRSPIAAPIQLGLALSGMAVGTGLVFGGVKRRLRYREWAQQRRVQLQPSVQAGPTSFVFGVAGRF
jgi:hypothetical protein